MGHMIEAVLQEKGIECVGTSEDIASFDKSVASDSVCIDFTWPDAFRANYPFIAQHFKAAVVGTTGWNDIEKEVFRAFEEAGTPLIYASNFSLGVNALFAAVEKVSKMLKGNGYTPAVEETHHIHKLDAPSGTAKSLGKMVEAGLGTEPEITAHRIGEVPGIHTVTYTSDVDKLTFTHEAFGREGLAGEIVEIVAGREVHRRVVRGSEIFYTLRASIAVVLARYVVRHEVNDDFQSSLVRAVDKGLKLLHTRRDVCGEVGVDIVVILDGIGAASLAFDDGAVVACDAVGRVIGLSGMLNDACVPDVCRSQFANLAQGLWREGGHRPAAVCGAVGVVLVYVCAIAEKACEDLINYWLLHVCMLCINRTSLRQTR